MLKNQKNKKNIKEVIPEEAIQTRILFLRGKRVMLDRDLAQLYGVKTRYLTRQVRRNINRFPSDFLLILDREEFANLKCQIGTSSWGGTRKPPLAFTEYGILMLSSVLNSEKAVQVNIQIMRVFVKIRELMASHKELAEKINDLERKFKDHDRNFSVVFEAIRKLMNLPEKPKTSIGFHT